MLGEPKGRRTHPDRDMDIGVVSLGIFAERTVGPCGLAVGSETWRAAP